MRGPAATTGLGAVEAALAVRDTTSHQTDEG